MEERSSLGTRLRHLRADKEESQAVVAAAIGIDRSFLAGIEAAHDNPGRETLIALANYFGVSVDWLASGEGDPHPTPLQQRTARFAAMFEALPPRRQAIVEGLVRELSDPESE